MIRAVVFDLDGTLLEQGIDFPAIRREIDAPHGTDIIEFLRDLPPDRRERARAVIASHEERAAADSKLNEGAIEVLRFLGSQGLPVAVFTRNSRRSLDAAVAKHGLAPAFVVCRNDAPPKPSPEPVLRIAAALGVETASLLAVGDYAYDTESAIRAGALSAYLTNGRKPQRETRAHFVVDRLDELIPLVRGLLDGSTRPGPPRVLEAGSC
ncbi:MAG: HAD family hydrolase [Planctomycetota bacterium]|jgi:HAD superfamily hydrolase (TIGR01549 family)